MGRHQLQERLIDLLSAGIYVLRLVGTEAIMLCSEEIIIEYQEVCVLTNLYGSLGIFDAKLLRSIDRISQKHFSRTRSPLFNHHFAYFKRQCANT